MKPYSLRIAALALPFALGACMFGPTDGNGVTVTPFSPLPNVAPEPSATTPPSSATGASAEPSLPPGVFFRDDFEGEKLDTQRWLAMERDGLVLVKDGALELLTGGNTATFPLLVPMLDNIPKDGPFYVELRYKYLSYGKPASFNLDYLPPTNEHEPGLTEPFCRWISFQNGLGYNFRTESRLVGVVVPTGGLKIEVPRRFRVEFDGNATYRVIYDDLELSTFESRRRPTRAWFGPYPNKPVTPVGWAHWSIDSLETGVLVAPDPARPLVAPTPSPSPEPMASPSLEPTASPET